MNNNDITSLILLLSLCLIFVGSFIMMFISSMWWAIPAILIFCILAAG